MVEAAVAADEATADPARCTLQSVQTAAPTARFPSSPLQTDPCTAMRASRSTARNASTKQLSKTVVGALICPQRILLF